MAVSTSFVLEYFYFRNAARCKMHDYDSKLNDTGVIYVNRIRVPKMYVNSVKTINN